MSPRLASPRGTLRAVAAILLLPLTAGVATPAIRWCGLEWKDVWLACAAAPEICRAESARCVEPSCGAADAGCVSRCGGEACVEAAGIPVPPEWCRDEPADAPGSSSPARGGSEPAGGGRAYCIDDAPAGPLPRSSDASPDFDAAAVAVLQPLVVEPPRPAVAGVPLDRAARPPTEAWAALPPVRAPPRETSA